MDWAELRAAIRALRTDPEESATAVARSGARLLQRALEEMYLGDPEALRAVAWALAESQPAVVTLRNVGVAVVATARGATVGDRMAAAGRSAQRLARLLAETPVALGRRAQPLLAERVVTMGYSSSVREAVRQGRGRARRVIVLERARGDGRLGLELAEAGVSVERMPADRQAEVLDGAQVVLLGCHALLADGSAVTGTGALALAREAAARAIPLHVFADTLKLAPWFPRQLGEGDALEVVPAVFVRHVVTEDGIRRMDQLQAPAADLAPRWRALAPVTAGDGRLRY